VIDLWASMKSLTLETVTQASFSLPLGLLDEASAKDRSVGVCVGGGEKSLGVRFEVFF
jgi:hypothetical protein